MADVNVERRFAGFVSKTSESLQDAGYILLECDRVEKTAFDGCGLVNCGLRSSWHRVIVDSI